MELKNILKNGTEFKEQVYMLYEEAFPAEEKKPISLMEHLAEKGQMELFAVTDQDEFVGLAFNMMDGNTALLDYFAVSPEKRNGGYGSKSLKLLLERFRSNKYIFEIEMQDEKAENAQDRKRRKAFYLRNGLKETGLFAHVYGTDFELLTPDGSLTYDEQEMIRFPGATRSGLHIHSNVGPLPETPSVPTSMSLEPTVMIFLLLPGAVMLPGSGP